MVHCERLSDDVRLILGDCRDVLPTLSGIDCIVSDPPYGIAHVWKGGFGRGWGNAQAQAAARNEWDENPPDAATLALLLSSAKHVILWGGNYFDLPPSRCWLVWNKPERGFTLAEAELAWTNIDTVVRVFDHPRSEPGRVHPTQKPVALMAWCIERVPKPARMIADPYMGSGTTGVAAVRLNRQFIGIEADTQHFSTACRRIADELRRPRLALDVPPKPTQEALGI